MTTEPQRAADALISLDDATAQRDTGSKINPLSWSIHENIAESPTALELFGPQQQNTAAPTSPINITPLTYFLLNRHLQFSFCLRSCLKLIVMTTQLYSIMAAVRHLFKFVRKCKCDHLYFLKCDTVQSADDQSHQQNLWAVKGSCSNCVTQSWRRWAMFLFGTPFFFICNTSERNEGHFEMY